MFGSPGFSKVFVLVVAALVLSATATVLLRDSQLWPLASLCVLGSAATLFWARARAVGPLSCVGLTALPMVFLAVTVFLTQDQHADRFYAFIILSVLVLAVTGWRLHKVLSLGVIVGLPVVGLAAFELGPRVLKRLTPPPEPATALIDVDRALLDTHFGELLVRTKRVPTVGRPGIYTFLAQFEDQVIWVDADARFYVFDPQGNVRPLALALDMKADQFRRDAPDGVQLNRYSVKDIEVYGDTLYISHHYWDEAGSCYTLRVSTVPISRASLDSDVWEVPRTLFESAPCLVVDASIPDGQLMETGGRLAFLEGDLILTLGDNMHDGRIDGAGVQRPLYAQDPAVPYGKTLRIDVTDGTAEVFTSGHRNPQGLDVDGDGMVWLTEHGPKGGDELNLLEAGKNYGWPLVTYGTEYYAYTWDLNDANGEHFGFEQPRYAWTPAIGISALIRLEQGLFDEWRGDVLVSSLPARSLFRVRLRENRVINIEQIDVGYPIRDLVETEDGRLILSTTNDTVLFIAPYEDEPPIEVAPLASRMAAANMQAGAGLFEARCAACHMDAGDAAGPSLVGMFDPAARKESDFSYSEPFSSAGIAWTEETLEAWLVNPDDVVAGTTMIFQGLPDPQDRADLIAYLTDRY